MKNIGPRSMEQLLAIGIQDRDDLVRLGPIEAWLQVKARWPGTSLNLLYALEGAVEDVHWLEITPSRRRELQRQAALGR